MGKLFDDYTVGNSEFQGLVRSVCLILTERCLGKGKYRNDPVTMLTLNSSSFSPLSLYLVPFLFTLCSLPLFVFFFFLSFEVRAAVNYRVWIVFTAASSTLSHHRRPLFNHLTSTLVKNAPLLTAARFQPVYSCVFLQNMFIILSLTSALSPRYFPHQPEKSCSAQIYTRWMEAW